MRFLAQLLCAISLVAAKPIDPLSTTHRPQRVLQNPPPERLTSNRRLSHHHTSHFDAAPNSIGLLLTSAGEQKVTHVWLPLGQRIEIREFLPSFSLENHHHCRLSNADIHVVRQTTRPRSLPIQSPSVSRRLSTARRNSRRPSASTRSNALCICTSTRRVRRTVGGKPSLGNGRDPRSRQWRKCCSDALMGWCGWRMSSRSSG
jgi:hypothetical protein